MSFARQLASCRVLPVIVAHDVKSTVRLVLEVGVQLPNSLVQRSNASGPTVPSPH